MSDLKHLFERNRAWAEKMDREKPGFFQQLAKQQKPELLWIGCSDSRVPANQLVDLLPGEIFVHRNVANVVVQTDLNCLSVLQFAVEVLQVKHVIVCGHYACGGVISALSQKKHGLIDNWLRNVQNVIHKHQQLIDQCDDQSQHKDLVCDLNVLEQAANVANTTVIQDAWARGQDITVHGWIYRIASGHLHDLEVNVDTESSASDQYQHALQKIRDRYC